MNAEREDLKFPKQERLHHRSLVESLFRNGKSFYEFPFRVTWKIWSEEEILKNFRDKPPGNIGSLQMLVTVPKKKRRRAVDRVLMRRRIREAYRLNRLSIRSTIEANPEIRTFSIAFIYIHNQNLAFKTVEEKMQNVLGKLKEKALESNNK